MRDGMTGIGARTTAAAILLACTGLAVAGHPSHRGGIPTQPPVPHQTPPGNAESPLPPALDAPKPPATHGAVIQLALLLDTSNSMDGLIDQARRHLWAVVADLAKAKPGCEPAQLQVALFQYGNDGLEASDGYVQLRAPFTCDLDVISEQLFALQTDGGSEFCGRVIAESVERLDWLGHAPRCCGAPVTRVMVIAGNEPFSQGGTPYASAIAGARERGVTVHTVFCGPHAEGEKTAWADGARLGGGRYCSIEQGHRVTEIATPYDVRIAELNAELNSTYIHFGERGVAAAGRQAAQDSNVAGDRFAMARRAETKASELYSNRAWDLVDALDAEETFDLDAVDRETLPVMYQDLALDDLTEAVAEQAEARRTLQAELRVVIDQRSAYLIEQNAEAAPEGLGAALIEAIRGEADGAQ